MIGRAVNEHHVLFDRVSWNSRKESKMFRDAKAYRPMMDKEWHKALHDECPPVPLLGYHALTHLRGLVNPNDNNVLESLDDLRHCIEEVAHHTRAHPIETQLAELAIDAIGLQLPFIRKGQAKSLHVVQSQNVIPLARRHS